MALTRSTAWLQETIDARIALGDLDSALRLIHRTVDQILCEPINTARIYGSRQLDNYCQEIGKINWLRIRDNIQPLATNGIPSRPVVVYVASCIYKSGGHSAALADMIRLGPSANNIILITNTIETTSLAAIQHLFEGLAHASFECAPHGTHHEKLNWLQRKLMELTPDTVWLFNHHQDSVAVAAVQPDSGYQLRYYHHGDHHLCLGVFLDYADHIDPHPMGFHNCRNNLGIRNNRYLPLIVKDRGVRPAKEVRPAGFGLITCTAAGPNKIEPDYFIHYADVIPKMLLVSGGKHIHIGPIRPLTLSRIKHGISKLGLPKNSFVHIPYVPSVWQALHEHHVDLYVASFPYGGARTLIEAMGAGVAIAIHIHCYSRLLCTFDMAFEGALFWRHPQELYHHIQRANTETLKQQGLAARAKYLECHSEEVLAKALSDWTQPLPPPPLLDGYVPDELQQALNFSTQVTCIGALRRLLNRLKQHWKSLRT